ncbi:MAG: DUF2894 domain-containing protein [Myxococcales bacterium]|nr:DUF2894 domain-containing protein [Myxococcales bacterium]
MRDRLDTLRAAGAEVFDGPGLRFVAGLLDRADALEGVAAEHLRQRAEARLSQFEARFAAARAEAQVSLAVVQAAGADIDGELAEAFERGDFLHIRHEAPRALRRVETDDADAARARVVAIETEEHPLSEARAVGDHLARALFREAAEHARSALVVARAGDRVPAETGPYNPEALTARVLALVESVSPTYLRAYLSGLGDLAALRQLPEARRPKRR